MMKISCLIVVVALAASAAALVRPDPPKAAIYYSVNFDGQSYTVTPGRNDSAVGFGYYERTMNTTGWNVLYIETNPEVEDEIQMTGAGFLEGYMSQVDSYLAYVNTYPTDFMSSAVQNWLQENWNWTTAMVAKSAGSSDYWTHVGLVQMQTMGFYEGYNAAAPADQKLNFMQAYSLSLGGDVETLGFLDGVMPEGYGSHCSALIKVTPDLSELYMGHTTWSTFDTMLRTYKVYSFPLSNVGAVMVGFSSYPGSLSSIDDFYVLSSGLAVTETTNGNYNASLYKDITPTSGVLSYIRVIVANRLATNGTGWIETFSKTNSGTYNNQWIIVDYNLFSPGQNLVPGTLQIVEQLPGQFYSTDLTIEKLQLGYFPSYNVPYFEANRDVCEFPEQEALFGPYLFSYERCARAEIFRRDEGSIESITDFGNMMRYNDYEQDTLSHGNAGLAISSRFDLVTMDYPDNPSLQRNAFGGIDSKITSYEMMQSTSCQAQSGPTHDDQPVFKWSAWPKVPHYGMPAEYDFGWVDMDFSATCDAAARAPQ